MRLNSIFKSPVSNKLPPSSRRHKTKLAGNKEAETRDVSRKRRQKTNTSLTKLHLSGGRNENHFSHIVGGSTKAARTHRKRSKLASKVSREFEKKHMSNLTGNDYYSSKLRHAGSPRLTDRRRGKALTTLKEPPPHYKSVNS
jgi:hypothetical protein